MDKFKELAGSRRFWVAAVSSAIALWLFFSGQINPDQLSVWVETALGVYGGSIGIEHAVKTWARNTLSTSVERAKDTALEAAKSIGDAIDGEPGL